MAVVRVSSLPCILLALTYLPVQRTTALTQLHLPFCMCHIRCKNTIEDMICHMQLESACSRSNLLYVTQFRKVVWICRWARLCATLKPLCSFTSIEPFLPLTIPGNFSRCIPPQSPPVVTNWNPKVGPCCPVFLHPGTASDSLVTALLQHVDLSGVWKLRCCEGVNTPWATCSNPNSWSSLQDLNLSSCGLTALPAVVGQLGSVRMLRLNHNKLTSLPPEIGHLVDLEVLMVNHNQLSTLPGEHCVLLFPAMPTCQRYAANRFLQ